MKLSFRWYGPSDPVTLRNIRQIPGMRAIVTAVYDVPVGEVWSRESIAALKKETEEAGLSFEVIESIPVHEDIKLGKPTRDRLIENYCENIRRVAEAGVKCVCYNFMPVFDWTRTELDHPLPDGSTSLIYDSRQVEKVNPLHTDSDLTLPGWDASYTREELREVVAQYQSVTEEDMWENLSYFLKKVIPVAAECGVNMAIHPDDPAGASSACRGLSPARKTSTGFCRSSTTPTTGSPSAPAASGAAPKTTSPIWPPNTRRWAGSTSPISATSS